MVSLIELAVWIVWSLFCFGAGMGMMVLLWALAFLAPIFSPGQVESDGFDSIYEQPEEANGSL